MLRLSESTCGRYCREALRGPGLLRFAGRPLGPVWAACLFCVARHIKGSGSCLHSSSLKLNPLIAHKLALLNALNRGRQPASRHWCLAGRVGPRHAAHCGSGDTKHITAPTVTGLPHHHFPSRIISHSPISKHLVIPLLNSLALTPSLS